MPSPDLPFTFRQGSDEVTTLHNRIGVIERIKFLTGVDLRERSTEYKQLIDCELYVKYYRENPSETISEEFCQRVAEVVRILEKEKQEDLNKTLEAVPDRVKQLYKESHKAIPQMSSTGTVSNLKKEGLIARVKKLFKEKKV